ncbi:hypothetical protein RFI_16847 [Reticulomyxa filosa]|uniref:Uncharacterized protein n=1 Tax=Reticulomyxa filosa TaxID=46433 RepID=X6N3R4_RETFI|nr:hypothetical protein RFI_16847 [Reticulomyxa filosa]|eukprot:ETO20369.1 hypothetical protein RFI_16847 [Reticulomyxa filosa]
MFVLLIYFNKCARKIYIIFAKKNGIQGKSLKLFKNKIYLIYSCLIKRCIQNKIKYSSIFIDCKPKKLESSYLKLMKMHICFILIIFKKQPGPFVKQIGHQKRFTLFNMFMKRNLLKNCHYSFFSNRVTYCNYHSKLDFQQQKDVSSYGSDKG